MDASAVSASLSNLLKVMYGSEDIERNKVQVLIPAQSRKITRPGLLKNSNIAE